jgi:hypothetical protein
MMKGNPKKKDTAIVATPSYRIMESEEIKESWDVDTSDSWSHLSFATGQTSGTGDTALPTIIAIPHHADTNNNNSRQLNDHTHEESSSSSVEQSSSEEEVSSSEEEEEEESDSSSSPQEQQKEATKQRELEGEPAYDDKGNVVTTDQSLAAAGCVKGRSSSIIRLSKRFIGGVYSPRSSRNDQQQEDFQSNKAVRKHGKHR